MNRPLFILVHGYLGSPKDLEPLAEALQAVYGNESARILSLHPDWHGEGAPSFYEETFVHIIQESLSRNFEPQRSTVLLGYSSGGCLALLALARASTGVYLPAMLILAASPITAELSQLPILESILRSDSAPPTLTDCALLAHCIHTAANVSLPKPIPVLTLHGDRDVLVPPKDLDHWNDGRLGAPVRAVLVPGADHAIFQGNSLRFAQEIILETVAEALADSPSEERLRDLEPALVRFAERYPGSLRRQLESPSVERALRRGGIDSDSLADQANPPVIANLEITTRCLLKCPACARTFTSKKALDMDLRDFRTILSLLPHAARVTFVGLGEPTLHPSLPNFVALAASQGRIVSLVTSGTALTSSLAAQLAEAGLGGITFSLDAAKEELAAKLRPGVSFLKIRSSLIEAAQVFQKRTPNPVSMAVFTAVSVDNVQHLDSIADLALELGARAWMLSDLNFVENQHRSIFAAASDDDKTAVSQSIERAHKAGLPVLQVHSLEDIAKPLRLKEILLRPAEILWSRSPKREHCLSPWQTIPVSADGSVTACDCQPECVVGNLFENPLSTIWNGDEMQRLREELVSGKLRPACKICPRL